MKFILRKYLSFQHERQSCFSFVRDFSVWKVTEKQHLCNNLGAVIWELKLLAAHILYTFIAYDLFSSPGLSWNEA